MLDRQASLHLPVTLKLEAGALDTGLAEDDVAREPEAIAELRRALGARLATFRLAAELTQGQLAKVAICDRTTLVHIEKGRARADERFWQAVDAACDADGALVAGFLALEGAKAEHERREHDLHLATVRAKAAELRGGAGIQGGERGGGQQLAVPMLDGLRRALLGHQPEAGFPEPPSAAHLGASAGQAHRLYQRADYEAAARLLPLIVIRIEAASTGSEISTSSKAAAYLAVAKLATKVWRQ